MTTIEASADAVRRHGRGVVTDVLGLAGVAGLSYGAWLAWAPAGFMLGGLLLLLAALALGPRNP